MKSHNANKIDFISKFKYWMLIPIILIVTAIVFGVIWGFNLDYDFQNVTTFNVKFGTTVTQDEYKVLENNLQKIVKEDGFVDYRIDRIGEGAQNGLIVKIVNTDNKLDERIDSLKTHIESNLYTMSQEKLDSSVVVNTSEKQDNIPSSIGHVILFSCISIACIMAFVFIYNWIRYNLVAGYVSTLTMLGGVAMLTAMLIVCRVPVNMNFVITYFVMLVLSVIYTTIINNCIKPTLKEEIFAKSSNSDRVYYAIARVKNILVILSVMLIGLLLAIMFFGGLSFIYTIISIIIGIMVALFISTIFYTSLWSFWYKRAKDNRLKKRIEAENKKKDKKEKEDEKILV